MKRLIILLLTACVGMLGCMAQQDRRVQYKPYIDLRPMHFGILIGAHLQDLEFENVGMQTITDGNGNVTNQLIVCDADRWSPGFSVGVLGELRLHDNFSLRIAPTMHFGAKHLTFLDLQNTDAVGKPLKETQDLKNTYFSLPIDIKFSAPRWNNHRPYIMAGIMLALSVSVWYQSLFLVIAILLMLFVKHDHKGALMTLIGFVVTLLLVWVLLLILKVNICNYIA